MTASTAPVLRTPGRRPAAPLARGARRDLLSVVLAAIGVVAFLLRLSVMVRGGGLTGIGAYDDGVYYAASDALVHGRLPYRDFLLIQPPLVAVVTAPFAALGAAVSDPFGYAVARLAFMAIGAVNAMLCGWILRRFGWTAVVVGGFGYAVFHPAVYAERSVLLEPLGTLGILLAILLLQRAGTHPRLAVLAGMAGGLAAGAKIWYIVPALLLLAMAQRTRVRYLVGMAVGGCAIYLPFLVLAPQRMVQEVILDQVGRSSASTTGTLARLQQILGAHPTVGIPAAVMAVVLGAVAAAAVVAAFATPGARVLGLLAVGTLIVLLLAPSWFPHYTALTAPPIALCLGVGAARLTALLPARWQRGAVAVVLVMGVLGASEAGDREAVGVRTPAGTAAAAAAVSGCITADDPGALIELDVLSRDLQDPRCQVRPDVTGWTYDPADLRKDAHGFLVSRPRNPRFQRDVVAFLESGDATIRIRPTTGYTAASKRTIDAGAVRFRDQRFVIRATHR